MNNARNIGLVFLKMKMRMHIKTVMLFATPMALLVFVIALSLHTIAYATEPVLPQAPSAGRYQLKIQSDGYERTIQIHLPKAWQPGTKLPLVLVLHGGGGNGADALTGNQWADKADAQGFIAVAPEGLGIRADQPTHFRRNPAVWNSGQYSAQSSISLIDDVAFITRLLDELKSKLNYDDKRVFAVGHSNGAGMTFRLAAQIPQRFAAIAMVAGRLAVAVTKVAKPVRTLYIVGTSDPLMPLQGGEVKSPWSGGWTNEPVATQLATWAGAMHCEPIAINISDQDNVLTQEYRSRSQGPSVTVMYLRGHGHHWPGAKQSLPDRVMGPMTTKVNATDTMWQFFNATPK